MDGFKNNTKMQCFKEGGSVKYESRKEHKEEMSADIKQDKAIVKKAIAMHDKQEHKGEKTDLSKLKKGGRAKKELGTARKFIKPAAAPSGAKKEPNKYKVGGTVSNVYEAKKKAGDLDAIEAVKNIKPGLASSSSKAAVKLKDTPAKFCGGGKAMKKYAGGGSIMAAIGRGATSLKEKVMGTPEQNRLALEREKRIAARKAAEASGDKALMAAQPSPTAPLPAASAGTPAAPIGGSAPVASNIGAGDAGPGSQDAAVAGQKKGGKVKRKC